MKSYYITLVFDGAFVTGFFVPQAIDEQDAIKQTKSLLIKRKKHIQHKVGMDSGELSLERVQSFLRCLNKPWRIAEKYQKDIYEERHKSKVLKIKEWNQPIMTGNWLVDCTTGQYLCNM